VRCVHWSIETACISLERKKNKLPTAENENSQSWQQYYTIGNEMGAYGPLREAEYVEFFCQGVSENNMDMSHLFAVCLDLGQILRIEIIIYDLLRTREVVDQDFQGGKLIVIESAVIAVEHDIEQIVWNREKKERERESLLGSNGFLDSNFGSLHPFNIFTRPRYHFVVQVFCPSCAFPLSQKQNSRSYFRHCF